MSSAGSETPTLQSAGLPTLPTPEELRAVERRARALDPPPCRPARRSATSVSQAGAVAEDS